MKKVKFLKQTAAALMIAAIAFTGCKKEDDPVKVSGVSLNKTTLELTEGGSETLTATVTPADAENKAVTWNSDKPDVATVADGKVTAVKAGTATITVTTADGAKTATCAVTVTEPAMPVNKIIATVENGAAYNATVDEVRAEIYPAAEDDTYIASGTYKDGGFMIELPVPGDKNLVSLATEFGEEATLSDTGAKIASIIGFDAFKEDAPVFCSFYYGTHPEDSKEVTVTKATYMYADRDVKVTGTTTTGEHETPTTLNFTLKKGWNIVYFTSVREVIEEGFTITVRTVSTSISSTEPSGMKWHYSKY